MNDATTGPATTRGMMLVLSSPSGAGKTTISRRLLARHPDFSLSVSVTTRRPRPGEVDGRDYHFVSDGRFEAMIAGGELLEHATVFGNRYGTPSAPVLAALGSGRNVLFDIDWQGAQQIAQKANDDLVRIFILPPSTTELERRLRARAQDSDDVVAGRMAMAASEISHWDAYDYVLVNDDLDGCLDKIESIISAERLKRHRQTGLSDFVQDLMPGDS